MTYELAFIKLTLETPRADRDLWIDAKRVVAVANASGGGTDIDLDGGHSFRVQESLEQVIEHLKAKVYLGEGNE